MASILGDLEPDTPQIPACSVYLEYLRIRRVVSDQSHIVVPTATKAQREDGCCPQFDELLVGGLPGCESLVETDTFDESQHLVGTDEHGLFLKLPDVKTQSVKEDNERSVCGEIDLHVLLLYFVDV